MSKERFPYTVTFDTPFSDKKGHNGKLCEVLSIISEPNDEWDMDSLPVFKVKVETGEVFSAFENEIDCEQTTEAVKEWCMNHLSVIAYREFGDDTKIEEARKVVEAISYKKDA